MLGMVPTVTATLRVAEYFVSIQGEGPAAGQYAAFLRLAGCNLSCSWCDTAYTWDASQYRLKDHVEHLTVDHILGLIGDDIRLLILTGGEPLIQQSQPAMNELLTGLPGRVRLHVETNGTIAPTLAMLDRVSVWMVSPKLDNAGPHRGHQNPKIHDWWINSRPMAAYLKMVCQSEVDAYHAVLYADALGWPRHRVWLMPEGNDSSSVAERWVAVANTAVTYGCNATHRLHVLAGWGPGQ